MRCTGCGAEMRDDVEGCLGLYHELSVHTLSDRDPTFPHQLAVDAYAAQHAGTAPKAITTAFTLIGLYLVNERGFTGRQAQRAHSPSRSAACPSSPRARSRGRSTWW